MPTIIECKSDKRRYILLGAGYGAWHSTTAHVFFGNWAPAKDSGTVETLCVCDQKGQVGWLETKDARVLSVSGISPAEALSDPT